MPGLSERSPQIRTFLYTDIEGSTRRWEQHHDAMEAALARHDRFLWKAVEGHGGSIFRRVGDGICAVFVNGTDAVAAALEAQLALVDETWGELGDLRVRMAIHTGEVEAQGSDYAGSSLNRMGRLLGVTYGGQTLISHATQLLVRDALPSGVELRDMGEIRLRDLSHPEHIFQLVHPNLPLEFPPLATLDNRPNNLPIQPTALIGREAELAEILERLSSEQVRMLTLTGPGGTGKTRLGLQAAAELIDRFEHGVFFVDLAPVRDVEAVLPVIARTIGLRETGSRPIMEELKGQLRAREMLLLLDNFEQIVPAGPELVELLQACPRLKMLVTSRERLHLRVEQVFPVPPLDLPEADQSQPDLEHLTQYEAVRLFIERAQAVKPDFSVTNENAPAVAEICIRLDGLPLAIELAASRIGLFPPQALLERLGSALKLLKGGARDLPTRQQTLRNTIGWSYELLEPAGQSLFQLLSVFHGGCTFEAVESAIENIERLEEMEIDPIEGLASLVDKSLTRQVEDGKGRARFIMLETIREYAGERLREVPEFQAEALRAHAVYFADFTWNQWEGLRGAHPEEALEELAADVDNVRSAWRYWVEVKDYGQLGKFFDALRVLFDARGWYYAMVDLTSDLLKVLSSTPSTPERAQQEILLQTQLVTALLVTQGYVSSEVEQAYTRAIQLMEEQGEIPQLFPVLRGLARYYSYRGEYDKAIKVGEQMLSMGEKLGDSDMLVAGHLVLGVSLTFYKDIKSGLEHLEQGIAEYIPHNHGARRFRFGADSGIACYIASSLNLWMLGYSDKAHRRVLETVELAKSINHPFSISYAIFHTGLLNLWSDEPARAEEYAELLNQTAREYDFVIWQAVACALRGAALVRLDRVEEGFAVMDWGMETYQGLKTPPIFWSLLLFNRAEALLHAGKPFEGLDALEQASDTEEVSARRSSEGALLAEFLRLRGDLVLAADPQNAPEAEALYQQALQVARRYEARTLELRAGIRLARLWRDRGEADQSRRMLSEIVRQMTEGHSSRDMQEAQEILGEAD